MVGRLNFFIQIDWKHRKAPCFLKKDSRLLRNILMFILSFSRYLNCGRGRGRMVGVVEWYCGRMVLWVEWYCVEWYCGRMAGDGIFCTYFFKIYFRISFQYWRLLRNILKWIIIIIMASSTLLLCYKWPNISRSHPVDESKFIHTLLVLVKYSKY